MQVLIRLAQGATSREVAHELCISLSTVETHRGHVLSKLNLRNNADLTRFAIRRDLVGVDD
jgi:DNA-binding NarL/FixJ family response regulator